MFARTFLRGVAALSGLFILSVVSTAATPAVSPVGSRSVLASTVQGTVKDSTGQPLPNVQVLVVELGRVTTSNDAGKFTIRGLAAGTYHLTATLIGYKPVHTDVRVPDTGADVQVALTMTSSPLRLETVNITAASAGGDPQSIAQSVSELSGASLQRSVGSTLAQTLSAEPGVTVRYNGAATMPVIRGLTGDRILVLQDGARTSDLSSAAPDHATTVDPFSAQRVEVVRGPASLLYGNNALGGVVNLISNDIPTSVPSHVDGFAGVLLESATPGGTTSLGVSVPLSEQWAATVRGSVHSASQLKVGGGGTLDNTQSRNWNGMGSLGWIGSNASFGFSLSDYDFNYGLPHAPDDDERAHIVGARQALNLRLALNASGNVVHDWLIDGTVQNYHHDEVSAEGVVGTAFKLKTQTAGIKAHTDFGRWHGTIGAQALMKQYSAEGDEALTPAADTRAFGAFVYQEVALTGSGARDERAASFQVGARFDNYTIESKDGGEKFGPARTVTVTSPSGSVGVSVPLSEQLTISASAALAFRAPTVEELYSNAVHAAVGDYEVGNPALSAEKNQGLDAQVRWQSGRATLSVSGYVNMIQGYIFPDVTKDTTVDGQMLPLAHYAQRDARLAGLEGSAQFRLTDALVAGVMGDYVQGTFRNGKGPLPFMPPGRVGASLRWDNSKFSFGGDVRYGMKQADVTGGADVATDAYTLVNLAAGMNIIAGGRVHSLTLRVDNVADTKYFDATSRIKEFSPNPGRNIALVYKVLF